VLSEQAVIPYLLEHGLLDEEAIVDGDVSVVNASRRNRNFKVVSRDGPGYLVKVGVGAERRATVAREAAFYAEAQGAAFAQYLPRFHAYDEERCVLVLELIRDAQSLGDYDLSHRRPSSLQTRRLGDALAALHGIGAGAGGSRARAGFRPWALEVHRPGLGLFSAASSASIELTRVVQRFPELGERLDEVRAGWSADGLIHGDLRLDNCLTAAPEGSRRKTRVVIVDWESVGWGDSRWDVGAVLSGYLTNWLYSIPMTGEAAPDRFVELAAFPLERIQPVVRVFWRAYCGRRSLSGAEAGRFLRGAIELAAARLVQTAYEQLQSSARLTGIALVTIQVALNVLSRPEAAAVHLLGLPLEAGMAA
jgi:aminoglycoside phosphotransferase (APT) family kinase protein